MHRKILPFICFQIAMLASLFISIGVSAQNFEQGFVLLDSSKYSEAEAYFAEAIRKHPNSLSAIVGYGRAIGLAGKTDEAREYFKAKYRTYPQSKEISMNYAESLLWSQKYDAARSIYLRLSEKYAQDAVLVFQLANIYSHLGEQEKAIQYIAQAIAKDPENTGFQNSQKHILLAYSYELAIDQEYEKALDILADLEVKYPNDEKIHFSTANTQLMAEQYKAALQRYQEGLVKGYDERESGRGIAVSHVSMSHPQRAMKHAQKIVSAGSTIADSSVLALAYLKRNQIHKAENLLRDTSAQKYLIAEYLSLRNKPEEAYHLLSSRIDSSRVMQAARITYAIKARKKSTAHETLCSFQQKYSDDTRVGALSNDYLRTFGDKFRSTLAYNFDSDSSLNYYGRGTLSKSLGAHFFLEPSFLYKKLQDLRTDESTAVYQMGLGLRYLHLEKLELYLSPQVYRSPDLNLGKLTYAMGIKYKLDAAQEVHAGTNTEVQDFNINLLNEQLLNTHYFLNYSMNIRQKYGLFLQCYHSRWSDGNTRKLAYASFYRILQNVPVLKLGMNAQYFGFDRQQPELYFSPTSFRLVEGFVELFKSDEATSQAFYRIYLGMGLQTIDQNSGQLTYRVEGEYGRADRRGNYLSLFAKRSNAASSSVSGFTYTQLGIRLRWREAKL